MILAIGLSLLIGLSLGLLGGGGSILTVPILIYALGVEEKAAIATSLLVVAITSLVAGVQHARAGNVKWKIALIFSGAGMAGAFGGGMVARYIPASILLILFAVIMIATAAAMWKGRSKAVAEAGGEEKELPIGKILLEGVVVGVVTGLVGAGGGFLVVPALALMGGLPMHQAVGTSLVVIALKSFAGFGGYVSHVEIDYNLAAVVTGSAVAGSFLGTMLGRRLNQDTLRKGFALFVLVMAFYLLYKQMPASTMDMIQNFFASSATWPFWLGGIAIGGFVLAFLFGANKLLGVSTGYMDACNAVTDDKARKSWRLPFIGGMIGGGAIATMLAGGLEPSFAMGMFDTMLSASVAVKAVVFTLGGVLIGFGARLAGGCTSGHSIVGVALLAPSSLIATGGFMAAGFVVTNLVYRVLIG